MGDTAPDRDARQRASIGDFLLVAGKGYFATHALAKAQVTIGRDRSCDVVIDDPILSRQHAVLRVGPPLTIQDLGSTNGVRITGREVLRGGAPIELAIGDGFHIGPFAFLIASGDSTSASSSRRSGTERLRVEDPTIDGVPGFVKDVARTPTSVLLLGETGAGKDVLAETLHVLSGRQGELARVNCAALAEPLIESELFGHEKGAFTGAAGTKVGLLESAQGGTVFLDEIGELPLSTQAKLLRAIESREVLRIGSIRPIKIDVRFIAATNRDLPAEVAAKRFRHDLYFRLDGITLTIPPLRERRHRIAGLAARFLERACAQASKPTRPLALEAVQALEAHDWPGNVRELKAVMERALLLARGGPIGARHLAFSPRATPAETAEPEADDPFLATLSPSQLAERAEYIAALEKAVGNQTRAAKILGISRSTMINRLRLYRIVRPRS
ncbi:MAG: sigma 54-interacting transcriptional regulator [Deltaproteobacteria bacterium]|nr:sigma 54-interacting transcriptional regulator [Deltaproteobacteria bacterium]